MCTKWVDSAARSTRISVPTDDMVFRFVLVFFCERNCKEKKGDTHTLTRRYNDDKINEQQRDRDRSVHSISADL